MNNLRHLSIKKVFDTLDNKEKCELLQLLKEDYLKAKEEIKAKGILIIDELTWQSGQESFYFNDPEGNVLIAGSSTSASGDYDYLVLKYGPDGSRKWVARYASTNKGDDRVRAMVVGGRQRW